MNLFNPFNLLYSNSALSPFDPLQSSPYISNKLPKVKASRKTNTSGKDLSSQYKGR